MRAWNLECNIGENNYVIGGVDDLVLVLGEMSLALLAHGHQRFGMKDSNEWQFLKAHGNDQCDDDRRR